MHFYQQNIADYRKKTMGLSPMEHGIYRLLMDTYYLTEQPLENDLDELMRSHSVRTADEQEAFKYVLKRFFKKTADGYRNKRCDQEIENFYQKSEKARASAKARWNKDLTSDGNTDAMRSHGKTDADGMLPHNPITPLPHNPTTQEPQTSKTKSKTLVPKNLVDLGVSESVANDWLILRKQKKAPATETALAGIQREATKAGYSLETALRTCCERGWTGFKAEWVMEKKPNASDPPWWTSDALIKAKGSELGIFAKPGESMNEFKGRIQSKIGVTN